MLSGVVGYLTLAGDNVTAAHLVLEATLKRIASWRSCSGRRWIRSRWAVSFVLVTW
jgi:hypothetical protein